MDKIIELFNIELERMLTKYKDRISSLPLWQLENYIPIEIKHEDLKKKKDYLVNKFINNDPMYLMIVKDLIELKKTETKIKFDDLHSVNVDPRYLESMGLRELQIESYFKFTTKAKALLNNN